MRGETTVAVDPPSRIVVVDSSERSEAVVDALSKRLDAVSLFRVPTSDQALDRVTAVDAHCVVCPADDRDSRSAIRRLREGHDSVPIVAVTADDADRALDAGASDVVDPTEPASVVAARIATAADGERHRLAAGASASRYRSILEGSSALVWVVGPEGDVRYVSPTTDDELDPTPDDLERRGPAAALHPDDRAVFDQALEEASGRTFGASAHATVRLRGVDGRWRLADVDATNRLADPHLVGIVVTIDLGLPAEASSPGPREALERIDDAVFVLGPRWEIRYANRATADLFGAEPRSGTVVWDLLPEPVRTAAAERFRAARATDSVVSFETSHPDRSRPLRVAAFPAESGLVVRASDGPPDGERADRDRLALLESVVDGVEDGVAVLEGSTVALANERLLEFAETDALVGRELEELFEPALAATVRERAESPVVRRTEPASGTLALGSARPVDVVIVPLPDGERTLCLIRDRRRTPAGVVSTVEEGVDALRAADSPSTVHRLIVEQALELTDAAFAGCYRVDASTVSPLAALTREGATPDLPAVDRSVLPVDDVREGGEASVHGRTALESFLSRSGLAAAQVLLVPVRDVLLVATSAEPLAFDPADLTPIETLTDVAAIALERCEHASRADEATRERAALDAALDLDGQLRAIERDLLEADTRTAVERTLCAGLASLEFDEGAIPLAWIGAIDPGGETIRARERAGEAASYTDAVSIARDEREDAEPTGRAAATVAPASVPVVAERPDEPWRDRALERGLDSVLSVPLVVEGFLYGVCSVYADRPNRFDERTRRAVEHLVSVAGFVVGALETRRAVVAAGVTELELVSREATDPLSSVARRLGCPLEVLAVVPRSSDGAVVFATVAADESETVADIDAVASVRSVGTHGGDTLLELVCSGPSIATTAATHGGAVRSVAPADGRTRFVVDLSSAVNVRQFVDALDRRFPGTELLARRERERSIDDVLPVDAVFRDRLSERQRQTLEAAYYGGYFEWPRESTGQEIADSLAVSQPTFSRHVRVAQHRLFSALFDDAE